jgi:endoglucanase
MIDTSELNLDLLKRLCETPGIPGREDAVRALVRAELAGLVDEVRVDALGNVIGVRRGDGGPRVMLAAHMDEIGFLVRHIDERGFIRLQAAGGFDPSRLPAQRVIVHGSAGASLRGAIGVAGKPIHLLAPDEVRPPRVEQLFVDIGLTPEEVRAAVEVGDMVTLDRTLERAGHNLMSKALDDRVGLFVMIEALRRVDSRLPAEVIAVTTTQEEVGLRGATTAAWQVTPDVALALDITPAGDVPEAPDEHVGVRLGAGVAVKVMDMSAIADRRLVRHLREVAQANAIRYQLEILPRGGTDAGAMQRARAGAPAATLSIPVRYAHTVNETCAVADVAAAIALLARYLERAIEGEYAFG